MFSQEYQGEIPNNGHFLSWTLSNSADVCPWHFRFYKESDKIVEDISMAGLYTITNEYALGTLTIAKSLTKYQEAKPIKAGLKIKFALKSVSELHG